MRNGYTDSTPDKRHEAGCSPIETKTERLKQMLSASIKSEIYPPGCRLPTELDLAKLHRVSRTTVRFALRELERAGMVQRRQGSGTWVRSDPAETRRKRESISLLRAGLVLQTNRAKNPFLQKLTQVFRAHLLPEVAMRMYFHNLPKLAIYKRDRLDVIIVDGGIEDRYLDAIGETGLPMIVILRERKAGSFICVNEFKGGCMMVELLALKGHRRIVGFGYASPDDKRPRGAMEQRCRGVDKAAKDSGLRLAWASNDRLLESSSFQQMFDHWFHPGSKFKAAVTVEPYAAIRIYDAAENAGIRIPEQLSLAAFDATYYHDLLNPPLTVIREPFEEIGCELSRTINNFADGQALKIRRMIDPILVEKNSVKDQRSADFKIDKTACN